MSKPTSQPADVCSTPHITKPTPIKTPKLSKPFLREFPTELELIMVDIFVAEDKRNIRKAILLNRFYWEVYHKKLFVDVRLGSTNWKSFYQWASPPPPPPSLLPIPTTSSSPTAPLSAQEGQVAVNKQSNEIWRRGHHRFKSICGSIVYLKIKDLKGGQAIVNAILRQNPNSKITNYNYKNQNYNSFPNLEYLKDLYN